MSFLDHLEELRLRIIRIIMILVIGASVCLLFSGLLISFLTKSFSPQPNEHLALLYPTEGFVVRLKVAAIAGLFLTSPLWFYQLWAFIAPGLYSKEKKAIAPVIVASSLMFLLGAGFGYYILPYAISYFQALTVPDVAVNWSLGKFIDFALRLLVAFGVIFELPLVIYSTARLGLVTPAQLRKYRRQAIVGILITSAFITPPDVLTQVILSIPLILLYELGIVMSSVAIKRHLAERPEQ